LASIFGHTLAAIGLGKVLPQKYSSAKFWLLGIFCSILPDADVLGFLYGIPYESFWGHRGFTHSLAFALAIAFILTALFHRKTASPKSVLFYVFYYFLCTSSHALLDMMTTGGLGVAIFSPWDQTRYFFPWRPIQVSPLGASHFFSKWGIEVLKSEMLFIGFPFLLLLCLIKLFKKHTV